MEAIDANGDVVISHPGYLEGLISEVRLLSLMSFIILLIDLLTRIL